MAPEAKGKSQGLVILGMPSPDGFT